ncbi:MAG: hypothetical protein WDW36_008247 [Sanguina aurantia]
MDHDVFDNRSNRHTLSPGVEFGRWFLLSRVNSSQESAAISLRDVLVKLGPAFVKIGQALSSRPDVLPPVYLLQMELLQDRIPPFPTDQAMKVIAAELGRPFSEVYTTLSAVPVAAASLGQVYRGRLVEGGQEVAVKVQRPGVYEQIALDVYILRGLAKAVRSWRKVNTDLPALVDEWAGSLFRELDYRQEGANATNFKRLFARLPEVFVPSVYPQFTSKQFHAPIPAPHPTPPHPTPPHPTPPHPTDPGCADAGVGAGTPNTQVHASPDTHPPTHTSPHCDAPHPNTPPHPLTTPLHHPTPDPRTIDSCVLAQVLTMEWVEGERLRTASAAFNEGGSGAAVSAAGSGGAGGASALSPQALEDLRLVEVGVRCSLEQILEEGVYHADPHPGNLLKMKDGRLAYLDFGMMGAIDLPPSAPRCAGCVASRPTRFSACSSRSSSRARFASPVSGSRKAISNDSRITAAGVFQDALKNGVTNLSFGQLSGDLGRSMYQYSFRIPPYYTLLVRSLTVLEGIALASDKDYKGPQGRLRVPRVRTAAHPRLAPAPLVARRPTHPCAGPLYAGARGCTAHMMPSRNTRSQGHGSANGWLALVQQLQQVLSAALPPLSETAQRCARCAERRLPLGGPPPADRQVPRAARDPAHPALQGRPLPVHAPGVAHAAGPQDAPLPPKHTAATAITTATAPTPGMAAAAASAAAPARAAAAAQPASALPASALPASASRGGAVGGGGGGGGAALQLLLGEEGDFVREIVVEELAKGLDAAWRLAADALVDDAKLRLKQVLDLSPIPLNALTQWIFPSAPTPALPVNVNVNNNGGGGGGGAGGGGGSGSVRITDSLADYSIDEDFSSVSTTGIMGGGGVGGGVLPAQDPALLRQLMDLVPKLADLEDRKQLDGLMRLSTILFKISGFDTSATAAAAASSIDGSDPRSTFATKTSSSGRSSSSASAVPDAVGSAVSSIQQAALLLRWLGTEVSSLPAESQRQAIQIPVDLISKVSSRVAARTLRSVFTTLPSAASPFPFPSISFPAASTSIPPQPSAAPQPPSQQHHQPLALAQPPGSLPPPPPLPLWL